MPAEAHAAGARDRVGASASLTTSPSATGWRFSGSTPAWMREKLEEVVDHAHHPVDLGADLAVASGWSARPRASASVIARIAARGERRSWDTHETSSRRDSSSRCSRTRDSCNRRAVRASSSLPSWSSAGPREPASNRPLSPKRRASSRMVRDHRANAVPMTNETPMATTPATVTTQSTTSRSWSERNIARAVPTTPATTASTAVRATTPTCQRKDRRRTTHAKSSPSRPAAPAQAASIPMIAHWSSVIAAPTGSRRPRRSPGARAWSGRPRPFAQPAHVHRHRRLSPNDQPHTCCSASSGEGGAGMRDQELQQVVLLAGQRQHAVTRVASWRPRSTTRSPSSSRPSSALVRSPARRSTDSTRSTSSRG